MLSCYTKRSSRAYTLVELLIVMAAITLLAAITVPSIKGLLEGQKVRSAAIMVKSHIESARARAMATGSPVAVMLERNSDQPNTVTSLAIGRVFPPYSGDLFNVVGTLDRSSPDQSYYDTITIDLGQATLLTTDMYSRGDFIQIEGSPSVFSIDAINRPGNDQVTIRFLNPPTVPGSTVWKQEPQLLVRYAADDTTPLNDRARFDLFRRPTKSLAQSTNLPQGTCVDLSVSGFGDTGSEFIGNAPTNPALVVFNGDGQVAWTDQPQALASMALIHFMVGSTDQVFNSLPEIMAVENEADSSTFNANINDPANAWVTINPFTGSVYSSDLQTGAESSGELATRLARARQFANNGINRSEN